MTYNQGDLPVDENSSQGFWVHHARLGLKLQEAMEELGLECHVVWPENKSEAYPTLQDFLIDKVRGE